MSSEQKEINKSSFIYNICKIKKSRSWNRSQKIKILGVGVGIGVSK